VTVPPLKLGIQAEDQTAPAFASVQRNLRQTENSAARMGSQFGRIAQQAGFQVGDFASQVSAGGSAMTAFVQQGSQFLGMFGVGGAIAGAALGIGAIGLKLWEVASSAKGATDAVSTLEAAIAKLQEEAKGRGSPAQPGIVAVERLRDLRADLVEQRRALEGTQSAFAGGVSAEFGGVIEGQSAREVTAIQAQIKALNDLISTYDRLIMDQERAQESTANLKRSGEEFEEQKKREAEAVRDAARAMEEAERARQRFLSDVTALENSLDPVTAATRRWADQQALLAQAVDAAVISQERYNELVAASDEAFRKATEKRTEYLTGIERQTRQNDSLARDLGFTFQSAFEDAILRGEKLRGVLAGIAQDLARIVMRQTVTTPLASLLMGGISSAFGGLFGGGAPTVGAALGPINLGLPGFADGGPVAGGRPIIVGEEGPELFVPRGHGQIIPNGQSAGGTVVNQTINISVGVAQTVRAEIAALMPAIKRQTVDAVADARMRGGTFASAMGT
jgi:hypothetical protein